MSDDMKLAQGISDTGYLLFIFSDMEYLPIEMGWLGVSCSLSGTVVCP